MKDIKMQPNSTVTYAQNKNDDDNCLIVDNYQADNEIWHLPIEYKNVEDYKTHSTVGCWRVKPTDK